MANLNNYFRQHREIEEIVESLKGNAKKETIDSKANAVLINSLSGKLKIHISMENKYLYPQLKENLKTKNTAESFEKEMEGILEVFLNFKEKYNTSVKIDENINLFKKETLAVLKALEERIAKEEKSLYTL